MRRLRVKFAGKARMQSEVKSRKLFHLEIDKKMIFSYLLTN